MPAIADDEVLVYVMAAASTTTTSGPAWAFRSTSSAPATRPLPGRTRRTGALSHRRQRRLRYRLQGRQGRHQPEGRRRGGDALRPVQPRLRVGQERRRSDVFPHLSHLGYETNWAVRPVHQGASPAVHAKPKHMTWEEASAYTLVAATAWRMLHGWGVNAVKKGDVALIWGGAGGLGSMAIQIARPPAPRPSPSSPARTSSTIA